MRMNNARRALRIFTADIAHVAAAMIKTMAAMGKMMIMMKNFDKQANNRTSEIQTDRVDDS